MDFSRFIKFDDLRESDFLKIDFVKFLGDLLPD